MTNEATPSSAPSFEELEKRLNEVLERLEDPEAPLEERVKRHREAVRLHSRMDAVLADARRQVQATEAGSAAETRAGGAVADGEPYEKVLARLSAAVEELERDDLPLARVLALHQTAEALADRCEVILKEAQGTLEELRPGGDGSVPKPGQEAPDGRPAAPDPGGAVPGRAGPGGRGSHI